MKKLLLLAMLAVISVAATAQTIKKVKANQVLYFDHESVAKAFEEKWVHNGKGESIFAYKTCLQTIDPTSDKVIQPQRMEGVIVKQEGSHKEMTLAVTGCKGVIVYCANKGSEYARNLYVKAHFSGAFWGSVEQVVDKSGSAAVKYENLNPNHDYTISITASGDLVCYAIKFLK